MSTYYPNGLGGTGAALATAPYLTLLGETRVWWVDSVSGVNGSSPEGASRERPLATLAQAVTNATAGDIIVLLSTHNETLGATVTVNKANLTIIGEGTDSSGIPSAALTPYSGGNSLAVSAAGVYFQHIRFKARTDGNLHATAYITAADCVFDDCYVEVDEYTNESPIQTDGTYGITLDGCTFISTETSTTLATAPFSPISISTAAACDVNIRHCVFDGGQTGFKDVASEASALDVSGSAVAPTFYMEGISLLRGAELHCAMTGGYANVPTSSGGGSIRSSTNVKTMLNGIGASSGTALATASPLIIGGRVWYVDSETGEDEAGAGRDRTRPFATLSEALSQYSAGDIIVLLSTHDESINTTLEISDRVTIIGEGYTSGIPTATLRLGSATNDMFSVTASRLSLRGIRFAPPTVASTASFLNGSDSELDVEDCYVEMNGFNDDYGFKTPTGTSLTTFRSTTFISSATSYSAMPYPAVYVPSSATSNVRVYSCTFDAGSYGFENGSNLPYAFEGLGSTHYRVTDTEFLNGADMSLGIATGYVGVTESSGSMQIAEANPS